MPRVPRSRKTGIEEHNVGSGFGNEVGDVFCRISLADNLEVGIIAQHCPNPLERRAGHETESVALVVRE